MKLHSYATNRTLLTFDDGNEVFFSYETPVAGYSNELGYVRTKSWYSSTTTRHINKYIYDGHPDTLTFKCTEVDQSVLNNLIKEHIPSRY